MKKVVKLYLTVFILIGVIGCSNETNDLVSNYVGYWETSDTSRNYSVVEIYENDGSFYADINVLSEKAPDGGVKVPAKLLIEDKDLYIDSPFINGAITYYSDNDRLVIGNEDSYARLTNDEFSRVKEQWEQCSKFREQYLKDSAAIPLGYERSKQVSKLREKYNENIKGLKRCKSL